MRAAVESPTVNPASIAPPSLHHFGSSAVHLRFKRAQRRSRAWQARAPAAYSRQQSGNRQVRGQGLPASHRALGPPQLPPSLPRARNSAGQCYPSTSRLSCCRQRHSPQRLDAPPPASATALPRWHCGAQLRQGRVGQGAPWTHSRRGVHVSAKERRIIGPITQLVSSVALMGRCRARDGTCHRPGPFSDTLGITKPPVRRTLHHPLPCLLQRLPDTCPPTQRPGSPDSLSGPSLTWAPGSSTVTCL